MPSSSRQAGLILRVPAKLNLTLEVLGKRQDGYHEVRSVMQTIELWDSLSLELRPDGVDLHCSAPHLENADNLVLRATESMRRSRTDRGVSITLQKGIPEAAGLGGGSSDAAATLLGLDQLWGSDLGVEALSGMANQLGADVAFFLAGGTALAEGRGERVTPLPSLPPHWAVVFKPRHVEVPLAKTARLYASLGPEHFTDGGHTSRLAAALSGGKQLGADLLFNVFEGVAFRVYPGLENAWQRFEKAGAPWIHLAGSGPALYTLTPDREAATAICEKLRGDGLEVYLARTRN